MMSLSPSVQPSTVIGTSSEANISRNLLLETSQPPIYTPLEQELLIKRSPLLSRTVLLSRANLSLEVILNMPSSAVMP